MKLKPRYPLTPAEIAARRGLPAADAAEGKTPKPKPAKAPAKKPR